MKESKCTEGHVANLAIGAVGQSTDALKLEWRFVSKQNLRSVLNSSSSGIDELLELLSDPIGGERIMNRTCKKTFPNILSVSSLNIVLNMTVTLSWLALMYIASSSR